MPRNASKSPNRRKVRKSMSQAGTASTPRKGRYHPPSETSLVDLKTVIRDRGYDVEKPQQLDLLRAKDAKNQDVALYYAGDLSLLNMPAVAIVGAREVSSQGKSRAYRLARELAQAGVVVVSGLAKGVDTAAHYGAIENQGRTIAVIGTPISKAYPAENAPLQEQIYSHHLLVSPFAPGEAVFQSNFPKRNRVMALLSDATVIVEASDTSGSLHQAAECVRSNRWLFIMKSVMDDPALTWPQRFLGNPKVAVFASTQDILDAIKK
jgi:DNA processing protein